MACMIEPLHLLLGSSYALSLLVLSRPAMTIAAQPRPPLPPEPPDPLNLPSTDPGSFIVLKTLLRLSSPANSIDLNGTRSQSSPIGTRSLLLLPLLVLQAAYDKQSGIDCSDAFVELGLTLQSSLKVLPSTSSLERKILILSASYQHSVNLNLLRVRSHKCFYSPITLLLDVFQTVIDVLPKQSSYSPLILLVDVCVSMLALVSGLSPYSLSNLVLVEYVSSLGLASDRFLKSVSRSYYPHRSPTNLSLFPYSFWLKLNSNVLRVGYMYCLLLNCKSVSCRMLLFKLIATYFRPNSPRWLCVARLDFGLKECDTEDSLPVHFKGSTLFSVADFKRVIVALVAVQTSDVREPVVFSISNEVIPLLWPHVVEIRGPLLNVSCLSLMTSPIFGLYVSLAVCSSECICFAFPVILLCKQSSSFGT